MKLYFAGPLFMTPERTWNAEVTSALRAAGHEVVLPQETEPGLDAPGIFAADVSGIDRADGVVAIMDGPDPDPGTAWEVGYAFGTKRPVVLVRTDLRTHTSDIGDYNAMLTQAATARIDLPAASTADVIAAILDVLSRIQERAISYPGTCYLVSRKRNATRREPRNLGAGTEDPLHVGRQRSRARARPDEADVRNTSPLRCGGQGG
jgi:nucleoside 2-deoxyribosyltransferase